MFCQIKVSKKHYYVDIKYYTRDLICDVNLL